MKRTLLLVVVFSFILFACGNKNNAGTSNSASTTTTESSTEDHRSRTCDTMAIVHSYKEHDIAGMKRLNRKLHSGKMLTGPLPSSLTTLTDAKSWIASYQKDPYDETAPLSLVISTASLIDYLKKENPTSMHIYFDYNSSMSNRVDLAMIGCDATPTHLYYNSIHNVFGNFSDASKSNIQYDANIDPNTFTPNGTLPSPAVSPTVQCSVAQQNIQNYQYWFSNAYTFSFLIDAQVLTKFLQTSSLQDKQQPGGIVPYLEIYFAYKNNDPSQLTLVLVGVDGSGNHVYYKSGSGADYVFEQCVPCPYCGVTTDKYLDGPVIEKGDPQ